MINDQIIFDLIAQEDQRQKNGIELIASENFVSNNVLSAMGSCLTNKYAEGFPKKRYYGGCQIVDQIEELAIDRAKELFGVEYANVQPHSGSQANAAVMLACLNPGDKILGFNLSHGGHLTHGSSVNFSGKLYKPSFYNVEELTGQIDYDKLEEIAKTEQPKLIICGASAYSQDWDYARFRNIADNIGALLLADIAHPAGLIAAKLLNNPVPYCHIITTTTHKTLRGPRGGMIMMGKDFENPWGLKTLKGKTKLMSSLINSGVFPGSQGGPLMHVIAAKAVCFKEAMEDDFKSYQQQILNNAKAMSQKFMANDIDIVSNGTSNHMFLVNLIKNDVTGKELEAALGEAFITVNKNSVPDDPKSPFVTSGIRIGTPAVTRRGFENAEVTQVADWITEIIKNIEDKKLIASIKEEVKSLCGNFPVYSQ